MMIDDIIYTTVYDWK